MASRDDPDYARAPDPDDLVRLCRALDNAGARYVLIGGIATRTRSTVDASGQNQSNPRRMSRSSDTIASRPETG